MSQAGCSQRITGVAELVDHYHGFLVDAWGVLHDGVQPYPGAVACLEKLGRQGKMVVIVSNAARRKYTTIDELSHVGIDRSLYATVVCSGELIWQALRDQTREPYQSLGKNGYYLGTDRSRGLLQGLDKCWVKQPEQASFILNTGVPPGYHYTIESVEPLLLSLQGLQLPMLCANPDLVAIRGGVMGISAGFIAQRYEQLGIGKVHRVGKPDPLIYAQALQELPGIPASRWLVIGDAFATDIRGATNAGLDSLLIGAGIHHPQLLPMTINKVTKMAAKYRCSPDYCCEYLCW
ncbi:MAG TPA: TIGR01459 family HAD-type hydrolase [Gammaproteobacteria bacterium]|nr:TIGR01459 family HAD-type hydrolase [Gammaproteobacteria bacterium]